MFETDSVGLSTTRTIYPPPAPFIHHPYRLSITRAVYPPPVPFIHHLCCLSTIHAVYPPPVPFIHHPCRFHHLYRLSTTCTVHSLLPTTNV